MTIYKVLEFNESMRINIILKNCKGAKNSPENWMQTC